MDSMNTDFINPTLARIYTENENIKGMLQRLEVIMDKKGYLELYQEYAEISEKVPKNEVLTEGEKLFGAFGVDTIYFPVEESLRKFKDKLVYYNEFKELSDCLNDVGQDTKNIFNKDESIVLEEYIEKNKELIRLIIDAKNSTRIHQFTELMDKAVKALFDSLKTLSILKNNQLLDVVIKTNSTYLQEHLASKVRKSIDTTKYKGRLEDDYIDSSVIYGCAVHDENIMSRMWEAMEYEEKQKRLEEERKNHISELQDEVQKATRDVQKCTENLLKLKMNRKKIRAKKILFDFIAVPAITIPLSCPLIGHKIGSNLSEKVLLTKTYTNTVDMNSQEVVSSRESFEELDTSYVTSVTICSPWKKNITGTSYSRDCTVYDYVPSEEELLDEDFHLTLDTLDYDNLVKKYPYEQVTTSIDDSRYLTEPQIYVTETYQDSNEIIPSKKYNVPFTISGCGIGIIFATSEILLYYMKLKEALKNSKKKLKNDLEKNEKESNHTNKLLKLTLKNKEACEKEYNSFVSKK